MQDDMIFITGAGRRVGYALAEYFLTQGHPVIGHYHRESAECEKLRQRGALMVQANFDDDDSVHQMCAQIESHCRSLRAIIHNASAFTKTHADAEHALQQFDQFYRIHMRTPWQINTTLIPLLRACSRVSDIVHITDIYSDNPNPVYDVYCASKAGLQNLSLSFAKQLAPKIKVNVIQPGPILFKEWHSEAAKKEVLSETLLGFEAGPEPIIKAASALLDNPYQTGAIIPVDGGRRLT